MWRRGLKLFKDYAIQVGMAVGLIVFFELSQIVIWKLLKGQPFPDGYDTFIWAVVVTSGASIAGVGALRATGPGYVAAKAEGAARVAAATPAQPAQVLAAKGSNVSVNTAAEPTEGAPDDGAVG